MAKKPWLNGPPKQTRIRRNIGSGLPLMDKPTDDSTEVIKVEETIADSPAPLKFTIGAANSHIVNS